ncbi:MAG: DNA-directed RNA polymerase subunit P [Promethearchaeota archaeon]
MDLEERKIYTKCAIIFFMEYVCAKCKTVISQESLNQLPGIKCPACGHRILYKKRPQVIKKVKAI